MNIESTSQTKRTLDIVDMVEEFQCAGCIHGHSPKKCEMYDLVTGDPPAAWCGNHRASTFVMGIGRIALGLPKGFHRYGTGPEDGDPQQRLMIRLYVKHPPAWDKFNVAVWKMQKDGFLFVRTYQPRINRCNVDVIQNGSLDESGLENVIDAGKFYEEMD